LKKILEPAGRGIGMRTQRISNEPGFWDLVDLLGRGGTDDWRDLFQRAAADPAFREEIRAALQLVDPELGAAKELWRFLIEHLEERVELRSPHPSAESFAGR
jgi:hypothetical protein